MLEKLIGIFYEGPNPPDRIRDGVVLFKLNNPNATKQDWINFCIHYSQGCYKTGWLRGYEWIERQLDVKPENHPDRIADALSNNWRLSEPVRLYNIDEQEPKSEQETGDHEQQYFRDRIGKGPSR